MSEELPSKSIHDLQVNKILTKLQDLSPPEESPNEPKENQEEDNLDQKIKELKKNSSMYGEESEWMRNFKAELQNKFLLDNKRISDHTITEYIDIPDDQLKNLSTTDYAEYLQLLFQLNTGEVASKHIHTIAERYISDITAISKYEKKGMKELYLAHEIAEQTRMCVWSLTCLPLEFQVPSNVLKQFFDAIHSEIPMIRDQITQALPDLIRLDNRNKNTDQFLDLLKTYKETIIERLVHTETNGEDLLVFNLIEAAWAEFGEGWLIELFSQASERVEDQAGAYMVLRYFSNRIGVENARKILKGKYAENKDFKKQLVFFESLGFMPEEANSSTIPEVYERFDIGAWNPNEQVSGYESQLLADTFSGMSTVLDIACGKGRHLKMLEGKVDQLLGIDLVEGNAQGAKEAVPSALINRANWHHLPFEKNSVDGAYILGRSFPDNVTVEDGIACLREIGSCLKPGGVLLVDLPDADKGYVGERIKSTHDLVDQLGIDYMEYGSYVGSPNGQDYVDRLIPTQRQFQAMAQLAGYDIELINGLTYKDHHDRENINYYWKLTKRENPQDPEELTKAIFEARTSRPSMYMSMISI